MSNDAVDDAGASVGNTVGIGDGSAVGITAMPRNEIVAIFSSDSDSFTFTLALLRLVLAAILASVVA